MPPDKRGFAQGITHSFSRFGNAVSPVIIAALIAWWSWRGSFIAVGLASFIWVNRSGGFIFATIRKHRGITPQEIATLPPPRATESATVPWWPLLKRMLPVTLTDFCYGWTLWGYLSWLRRSSCTTTSSTLSNRRLFASGVLFAGVIGDTVGGGVERSDHIAITVTRDKRSRLGYFHRLRRVVVFHAAGCSSSRSCR